MKSTSLSMVFTELTEALIASNPDAFRKIAQDESHDLLQSVLIEQRALGELLAYGHENIADVDLEQVGWMMVAWAEVGLTWYRNWYDVLRQNSASDKFEGGAVIDMD